LKVSEYTEKELFRLLARGELLLDVKPFVVRVRSDIPGMARDISLMYSRFDTCGADSFADFHIAVLFDPKMFGRMFRRARFFFDDFPSFIPLPSRQAFAMFEWGLNWCVAAHAHHYLIIHAAVLAKEERAVILPGPPGSGKSTLCAALVLRGWRLLSDELALFDMDSGLLYGMSRPVNLKNASIGLIERFAPDVVLTGSVSDTTKGVIALMRPPDDSVRLSDRAARPAWIVAVHYSPGASPVMERHDKAETFMRIAEQSFNYDIHGARGFSAVSDLVEVCQCHRFTYGALDDAVRAFEALWAGKAA
jgi:HprK-related kinase A